MADNSPTCGVNNSIVFGSDPANTSGISAVSVPGAIEVSWNYPGVNSQSVAHFKIYRGVTNEFSDSAEYAVTKGNKFTDRTSQSQAGQRYYYWVKLVSINGTSFSPIGPATTVVGNLAQDTLALLVNKIDQSHLAQSLRTPIDEIPSLRADLVDETTNRLNALIAVDATLQSLGLDTTTAFNEIINERTQRINGLNSLASQLNVVAVSNGQNLSAIIAETQARVTANSAQASKSESLAVRLLGGSAAAQTDYANVKAGPDGVISERINQMAVQGINSIQQDTQPQGDFSVGKIWIETDNDNKAWEWDGSNWQPLTGVGALDAFAAVSRTAQSINEGDFAYASTIEQLEADVETLNADGEPGSVTAKAKEQITTQVGFCMIGTTHSSNEEHNSPEACEAAGGVWKPLSALSEAVQGVQIDTGDDDSGNSTRLEARMTTYQAGIKDLRAEYTVKINTHANGNKIVGGFGLASGEEGTIDAGFDVNTFWVGVPGAAKTDNNTPFIIDTNTGIVYIKKAQIKEADIDTLKLKGKTVNSEVFVDEASIANVVYCHENSNSRSWRSKTSFLQDVTEPLLDPSFTQSYVNRNYADLPSITFTVDSVAPKVETYTCELMFRTEVGIKSRTALADYAVLFKPSLTIRATDNQPILANTNITALSPPLAAMTLRCSECVHTKRLPYETTYSFAVQSGREYEVFIEQFQSTFGADTDWGSTPNKIGDVLEYGFMNGYYMSIRYLKR